MKSFTWPLLFGLINKCTKALTHIYSDNILYHRTELKYSAAIYATILCIMFAHWSLSKWSKVLRNMYAVTATLVHDLPPPLPWPYLLHASTETSKSENKKIDIIRSRHKRCQNAYIVGYCCSGSFESLVVADLPKDARQVSKRPIWTALHRISASYFGR